MGYKTYSQCHKRPMGSLQSFKNVGFVQVMHLSQVFNGGLGYCNCMLISWVVYRVCASKDHTDAIVAIVMSQPYRPLSRMCIKVSKRESICCVSCSIPLEFMNLKRSLSEYKKDVCKS